MLQDARETAGSLGWRNGRRDYSSNRSTSEIVHICPTLRGLRGPWGVDGAVITHYTAESDAAVLAGLGKPGPEGKAAQRLAVESLQAEAGKSGSFGKLLETLAKTVSKEAAVEAC